MTDRFGQEAQVLSDDVLSADGPVHAAPQVHARTLAPYAAAGILIAVRNGVVGLKTAEVVDAEHIIDITEIFDAAHPPGEAISCHVAPIKQRVAPKLSGGGEAIRWTAGNFLRILVFIQLEQLRMCPDIDTVQRNVDRQVTNDLNALFVGIFLQCIPLFEEEELQHFPEVHFRRKLLLGVPDYMRIVVTQSRLPVLPWSAVIFLFQRHEEGVVLQPVAVEPAEIMVFFRQRILLQELICRFAKDRITFFVENTVIDVIGFAFPVDINIVFLFDETFGTELIQIDEVRITGEGGERLIRRISVTGWTDGKQLPVGLSRFLQEGNKISCGLSHGADTLIGSKGGEVHQNAVTSHGCSPLS